MEVLIGLTITELTRYGEGELLNLEQILSIGIVNAGIELLTGLSALGISSGLVLIS